MAPEDSIGYEICINSVDKYSVTQNVKQVNTNTLSVNREASLVKRGIRNVECGVGNAEWRM